MIGECKVSEMSGDKQEMVSEGVEHDDTLAHSDNVSASRSEEMHFPAYMVHKYKCNVLF